MFDTDIHGTTIEAIANDLRATADYLLTDRKDGDAERRRKTVLHVTAARSMLLDVLDDIEEADETDYSGIPYVEVGYADGSSMRTTGHFHAGTVADVARLIQYESAEDIPPEA
jgi:hypothetical protein